MTFVVAALLVFFQTKIFVDWYGVNIRRGVLNRPFIFIKPFFHVMVWVFVVLVVASSSYLFWSIKPVFAAIPIVWNVIAIWAQNRQMVRQAVQTIYSAVDLDVKLSKKGLGRKEINIELLEKCVGLRKDSARLIADEAGLTEECDVEDLLCFIILPELGFLDRNEELRMLLHQDFRVTESERVRVLAKSYREQLERLSKR